MNYTFIPAGEALPHEQDDCIIMTTSRDTKKFINLVAVCLLSLLSLRSYSTTSSSLYYNCSSHFPVLSSCILTSAEPTSLYPSPRLDNPPPLPPHKHNPFLRPQRPNLLPPKHKLPPTKQHQRNSERYRRSRPLNR